MEYSILVWNGLKVMRSDGAIWGKLDKKDNCTDAGSINAETKPALNLLAKIVRLEQNGYHVADVFEYIFLMDSF